MRADMFQVVIERPRLGHSHPQQGLRRRRRARGDVDELPRHEGMKGRHRTKALNENLAPLRRFLERSVGRPWTHVYAELSAHVSARSAVQQHVRDHLRDFVVVDVEERGGVLWGRHRWQYAPLTAVWRDLLYVDPRTGLLARLPQRRRTPAERRCVGGRWYARVDGVWSAVELAAVPLTLHGVRDVVLDALVGLSWTPRRLLVDAWGRDDVYARALRPLTKRERVAVTQGGPARVR